VITPGGQDGWAPAAAVSDMAVGRIGRMAAIVPARGPAGERLATG
jgi:hypothetical protein